MKRKEKIRKQEKSQSKREYTERLFTGDFDYY